MTLNCSSRSDGGRPERLRERRPDQRWADARSRCGLGWASARKPRAPSQEPSKRFGVCDPHENPGHRPNDSVLAALRSRPTPSGSGRGSDPTVTLLSRHHCFQSPTMSYARKKNITVIVSRGCCRTTLRLTIGNLFSAFGTLVSPFLAVSTVSLELFVLACGF